MLYGPMMSQVHLLAMVKPALLAMCAEYRAQRERGAAWRIEIEREVNVPQLRREFDRVQDVAAFPIACAIALVADNASRTYALMKLKAEKKRKNFGNDIVPGVPFGRVLWVAANAARHYGNKELFKDNEAVLNKLDVSRRDEGAVLQLLEAAHITDAYTLLEHLAALFDQIDDASRTNKQ